MKTNKGNIERRNLNNQKLKRNESPNKMVLKNQQPVFSQFQLNPVINPADKFTLDGLLAHINVKRANKSKTHKNIENEGK